MRGLIPKKNVFFRPWHPKNNSGDPGIHGILIRSMRFAPITHWDDIVTIKPYGYGSKLGTPKLWMVNTKLDIHICGPLGLPFWPTSILSHHIHPPSGAWHTTAVFTWDAAPAARAWSSYRPRRERCSRRSSRSLGGRHGRRCVCRWIFFKKNGKNLGWEDIWCIWKMKCIWNMNDSTYM